MENKTENIITIKDSDVLRLLKYSKKSQATADQALRNVIIPFSNFESVVFNEQYWSVDKREKYGNTYQLYIQSLRICAELMNVYENSRRVEYLDKAEEIIYSWMDYAAGDPSEEMLWYDHPTSHRTQVLIQFIYLSKQLNRPIDDDEFSSLLLKHGELLSNPRVYKQNNHGIMMDRSLMVLGSILQNDDLFNTGYYRVKETFWMSFSRKGIHLENTPDYHRMVVGMYEEIEDYLNLKGLSLGENIMNLINLAKRYPQYLAKPNGRLPSIGDSKSTSLIIDKLYENVFDEEAGIALLQYESPKPVHLAFVCGYSSKVHKHKDDLSINLNYNGLDFFEDPGIFNYSKSSIRSYITSKEAHTSFFIKELDYSIKNENRFTRKIKMTDYHDTDAYTLVKGQNGDYDGTSATLSRTVVLFKEEPFVLILDAVESSDIKKYTFIQNFNLSRGADITEVDGAYRIRSGEETLLIKQFIKPDSAEVVEGDVNKPVAVNSTAFGEVKTTRQIRYEAVSNRGMVFATTLYDDRIVEAIELTVKKNRVFIKINGKTFYLDT